MHIEVFTGTLYNILINNPTNQENWSSVGTIASTLAQYSTIYGNTVGHFFWFVGKESIMSRIFKKTSSLHGDSNSYCHIDNIEVSTIRTTEP